LAFSYRGGAGVGFGFAVPLRPRLAGFGAAGGIGPASSPGMTGATGAATGSAGAAALGASAGAGAGGGMRRFFARDVPAGVNVQTWVAPGTLIRVSRSRDFFARIETIVGATPG